MENVFVRIGYDHERGYDHEKEYDHVMEDLLLKEMRNREMGSSCVEHVHSHGMGSVHVMDL